MFKRFFFFDIIDIVKGTQYKKNNFLYVCLHLKISKTSVSIRFSLGGTSRSYKGSFYEVNLLTWEIEEKNIKPYPPPKKKETIFPYLSKPLLPLDIIMNKECKALIKKVIF